MFLITSAAYISDEFASEIGLLPPSFLPLGNRCLYEHQSKIARKLLPNENICLSVPENFELSDYEKDVTSKLRIEIIRVPEHLSLGNSILYCLNMLQPEEGPVHILHGDTLYKTLPLDQDLLSLSSNTGYYHRAIFDEGKKQEAIREKMAVDGETVLSGYFSFSSSKTLIQSLAMSQGNYTRALNFYHTRKPLKAVTVDDWYDFGHINSYFNSRASFTTERSFNALKINTSTVKKSSNQSKKITGESLWFQKIPNALKIYTPKLLDAVSDNNESTYLLEYIYNLPLNDLYVFGRLDKETWRSIFLSCAAFLDMCKVEARKTDLDAIFKEHSIEINGLYLPKTLKRLEELKASTLINIETPIIFNGETLPSPADLAEMTATLIDPVTKNRISIAHGDFCFSNILYDFRTRRIKVLDPRGVNNNGNPTLFGDERYDTAKLFHSVVGLYDLIISGRITASSADTNTLHLTIPQADTYYDVIKVFQEVFFHSRPEDLKTILAINIQLFLSMLPLHSDRPDRQITMLANAYRLFKDLNP